MAAWMVSRKRPVTSSYWQHVLLPEGRRTNYANMQTCMHSGILLMFQVLQCGWRYCTSAFQAVKPSQN